jgi:hypothetical protein
LSCDFRLVIILRTDKRLVELVKQFVGYPAMPRAGDQIEFHGGFDTGTVESLCFCLDKTGDIVVDLEEDQFDDLDIELLEKDEWTSTVIEEWK